MYRAFATVHNWLPEWVDALPAEYVDEQIIVWRAEVDEEMAAKKLERLKNDK